MPTTITLPQIHTVPLGSERIIPVDYTKDIGGSSITAATAAEQTTSTLGITGTEPSDGTYTSKDTGATVAAGSAVWFRVIPTVAGTYSVLVTATTDSTNPGREVIPYLIMIVVA